MLAMGLVLLCRGNRRHLLLQLPDLELLLLHDLLTLLLGPRGRSSLRFGFRV